ncbi:MAG: hypothetical protein DMD78_17415 [Candidatus Rokuibacteriota bacterium]|nr:MAG: hypothetical protein DMD78_17415 [Candidatus Rokubacteria bacterium]
MTTERLEPIDGANWEVFLKAPWAVLMLGKSDCEHCHEYTEELHGYLGGQAAPADVRFGKMLLDRGGLATFKRANPWLAEVDVLPYTLIYRGGEKVAEFAGGGVERLQTRLERLRAEGR